MGKVAIRQIVLDANVWRSREDVYEAFLPALGAPDWHGRNLDALWDSLTSDDINEVKAPFAIEVQRTASLPRELRRFLRAISGLFDDARQEGIEVSIVFNPPLVA